MTWNWRITTKRRENLVKICLNAFTADLAGLVIPLALNPHGFRASILLFGFAVALMLCMFIFLLEN